MMKYCIPVIIGFFFFLFSSCSMNARGGSKPSSKISRSAVDSSEYKDVTLANVNAKILTKTDFAVLCSGEYKYGNSSIVVDFKKGRLSLRTDSCQLEKYAGKSFSIDYIYTVKAASSSCLYLCPSTYNNLHVECDGVSYKAVEFSSFAAFIPLYGFGQNRLEVSSILAGEIAMPSGTYWKTAD